jgi:hypothetical protein
MLPQAQGPGCLDRCVAVDVTGLGGWDLCLCTSAAVGWESRGGPEIDLTDLRCLRQGGCHDRTTDVSLRFPRGPGGPCPAADCRPLDRPPEAQRVEDPCQPGRGCGRVVGCGVQRARAAEVDAVGSRFILIGIRGGARPARYARRAQLRWLIAAKNLPVSDAQLRAHFNAGLLSMLGSAALNQALRAAAGARLMSIEVSEPSMVIAVVSPAGAGPPARVTLVVDSRGLIGLLDSSPVIPEPVPTTWAVSMPASARSPPGYGCWSLRSPTAHVGRCTASTPTARRRSARS